jgi:serine/threonine protein kinase/tetratricopeptide (TPR) repeat protein
MDPNQISAKAAAIASSVKGLTGEPLRTRIRELSSGNAAVEAMAFRVIEGQDGATLIGGQGASRGIDKQDAATIVGSPHGDDGVNDDATRILGRVRENAVGSPARGVPPQTSATTGPKRRKLGAYTLIDLLGEGGMGAVYLAEQDRPRRMVALKLIRPGLVTPRLLKRFELESEMLARLQHPGIAQIFEAGAAPLGGASDGVQPYFAMEYVRGPTLTAFARDHGLSTRERLALFTRVCDAVHHAHQKGVIHRDLKPGNILVNVPEGVDPTNRTAVVAAAQPKVLDFGVARAADADADSRTMQTEAGQLIGTLAYMSPEQVAADPAGLDTRSDVYTLGVILFELLSGRLPHVVSHKTIPDAVRTISEEEPALLSTVDKALAGDAQTIVAKALEKDRQRRYQSASELGADIERMLRDEPILARPPTRAYLFKKFATRNKAMVVASGVALTALVGAVAASTTFAIRAEAARELAAEEAQVATATNDFLVRMLSAASPDSNNERELTVREMVDQASDQLARDAKQDDVDAAAQRRRERVAMSLHETLSSTYRALGKMESAEEHALQAVAMAERTRGVESLEAVSAQRTLAIAYTEAGKIDEAVDLTRACLKILERRLGPDDIETARTRAELGRTLLEANRFDEAEIELRAGLDRLVALRGEKDTDAVIAMDHLGLTLQRQGKFDDAERMVRKTLAIREEIYGKDSTLVAFSLNNLANIAQRVGRNGEASELLSRALEIRKARLEPTHPSVLVSINNLAVAYVGLGRREEAERLFRESWTLQSQSLGEAHPKAVTALGNLAYVVEDAGRLDEAEALYRKAADLRRQASVLTMEACGDINNLAMLLCNRGKPEEAEDLYREVIDVTGRSVAPDHYAIGIYRNNLGACLTQLQKFQQAELELTESRRILAAAFGPAHPRVARADDRLRELYTAWGKPIPGAD